MTGYDATHLQVGTRVRATAVSRSSTTGEVRARPRPLRQVSDVSTAHLLDLTSRGTGSRRDQWHATLPPPPRPQHPLSAIEPDDEYVGTAAFRLHARSLHLCQVHSAYNPSQKQPSELRLPSGSDANDAGWNGCSRLFLSLWQRSIRASICGLTTSTRPSTMPCSVSTRPASTRASCSSSSWSAFWWWSSPRCATWSKPSRSAGEST